MDVGPVEVLVISFPGNEFNGDVAPALAELVQSGLIRIIDLVFVAKDVDGAFIGMELSDIPDAVSAAFSPHVEESNGLLSEDDMADVAAELAPNSSAAILVFEHVWATRFRDAVVDSGGELVSAMRIPKDIVDDILAIS